MTQVPDRHSLCLSPDHRHRPAHPFSDSQSNPNPCQTFSMKRPIATLCLTIAVLAGAIDASWGSDAKRTSVASNAMQCSSFYLIATSAYGENKPMVKTIMAIQSVFDGLYSVNEGARTDKIITNGMISRVKSDTAIKLGRKYDRNPATIYTLEMRCNLWREQIAKLLKHAKRNRLDIRSSIQYAADIPNSPALSDTRWSRSKTFVDNAFSAWTNLGRVTPYQLKQNLMRD